MTNVQGRELVVLVLLIPLIPADIKKHTSDDNPDKVTLERAIESLREVMT